MKKDYRREQWGEMTNIPSVAKVNARYYSNRTALESVDGTSYTYSELEKGTRFLASMLESAGLGKGSHAAILGENSPHWVLAYFGILASGAVTVPILPDFRESEIQGILEHAGARSLFISAKMLSNLKGKLPASVELVVNLDDFQVLRLEDRKIQEPENPKGTLTKLELIEDHFPGQESFYQAGPDDLASIIYTSGTTGRSKGVMLTHGNILSNAMAARSIQRVVEEDVFLSILPLAHTYECTIGMMVPLTNGSRVFYIDRAPTASYLGPILQKVRPTTMLTVPMIIEKIFAAKIKPALYGKPLMKALMGFLPTRLLLSRAASKKLQAFFGGRIRFFGVGGAPLAPDVERFLVDGKFPYAIGYGLTETAPMLAGFNPQGAVYRSVGKAMDGVTLRIDNPDPVTGEGEIVATGPNIMKGYYKDEERTAEVFTDDGYFRTGDLATMNKKGIIHIRGRLKNMILGPNGENIYPEEIEAVINREDIVDESLVMQVKGKLVARVHLKAEILEERFQHLKEDVSDFQHMLQEKADEILAELLVQVNAHIARNSKLQMMILQATPFEKTPTKKIKRFLYKG